MSGALCCAVALGLAIVHFSQSGRLHEDFNRDPGPALLPVVLLVALGLSGLLLVLRGALAWRGIGTRYSIEGMLALWPAGAAVAVLASFLPLRNLIGAAPALTLIGAGLALLAGRHDPARKWVTAALGAATGLAFFALFTLGLSVPL